MEQYWSLIQDKICRKCIDGDGRGNCRLPAAESCAIQEFLPQIVQTVRSVDSDSYSVYVSALRSGICAHCPGQDADGVCKKRDDLECALDRYYGLVLAIIDDVKERPMSVGS